MRWFLLLLLTATAVQAEDLLPDERRARHQDALYGQALFNLHSGEYAKALGQNSALRKGKKGYGKILDIHAATAQLGLGMSRQAKGQFQALISDKRISFIPQQARAQAWFFLGKHFYNKGLWDTALQSIRKINPLSLDKSLLDEYHFLATTLELFKGNAKKADKHILAINPASKWSVYAFLNLAVSYTERDVHTSKVEAAFNKALNLSERNDHAKALNDKINLMAGKFFFATGRSRSAIKHLKSIGLDSAYTPKALLTYGWALTEQWQYHDALQPWYMLKTGYSPLNQDVQETLIAIPHLLERLNAKVMALGAFDYASEQFDLIYKQLEKSAKRLNTGEFIEPLLAQQIPDRWGAFETVDLSLPNHPDRIYLKDVMSRSYFQGELKNLRDLHVMRFELSSALKQLDAFSHTVTTRKSEYKDIKSSKVIKLQTKKLIALESRYKSLLKNINIAFKNPNGTGLASAEERTLLKSFESLKVDISALAASKKIQPVDYEQRLRRLSGVLNWQLSSRYLQRKKQVSKNLAILKRNIRQTQKQLDATQYAYKFSPTGFTGFERKVVKLRKKYQKQLKRLNVVYHQQKEKVGSIVKVDIKKRQEQVVGYQLQARLASARLFDETSNKNRIVATGGIRE